MNGSEDPAERYRSPLAERYASPAMQSLFSPRRRILAWRDCWIALAEAQHELGLGITREQVEALKAAREKIDFDLARRLERELRHDVMAHIKAYGAACPAAAGVIHLGATSCFVTDNGDLLLVREALGLVRAGLAKVIQALAAFAEEHRNRPALAYTHFQPAQLTTVGKRAALWIQDLVLDLEEAERFDGDLRLRGVKGTTGTQASYLKLFDGDHGKVEELDRRVCRKLGFEASFPVTGQTYPRKVDARLIAVLAGIAASAYKFAGDLRLLAHKGELEEPFLPNQVGSSAMAYKRNPMRSERICALSRYLLSLADLPFHTAANQWLERTLDDSAARRIVIPESFLATDAILALYGSVVRGLVVHPAVIARNLEGELEFMATENLLMQAVKRGGDRQALHEKIRRHAMEAAKNRKDQGGPAGLLDRLAAEPEFADLVQDRERFLDPRAYTGRAAEQVTAYLEGMVKPILAAREELLQGPDAPVEV